MKRIALLIVTNIAILCTGGVVAQPSVALPDSLASMRRIEAIKAMPVEEVEEETAEQPKATQPTMDRATAEQRWEEANQLYIDGKFEEALALYKQLTEQGFASAALFYNTANAYYRTGDIGHSILFYNRALRLAPAWDDARYNLEIAERHCKDNIKAVPEILLVRIMHAIRDSLSGLQWCIISIILFANMLIGALMFFVGQRNGIRRTGFYTAIVSLVLTVATTLFAASARRIELSRSEAIVVGKAISVKSSPDKAATDVFVLHEGTKVNVETEIDGWCEITIANGNKGWTQQKSIERI
ncbi:MAG: competence protein [Alistipes sp.]|nr:competence protein [Alistipes sp.]